MTNTTRKIHGRFFTRLLINDRDAGSIETHTGRSFAVTPAGDMILAINATHAEQILLRINAERSPA